MVGVPCMGFQTQPLRVLLSSFLKKGPHEVWTRLRFEWGCSPRVAKSAQWERNPPRTVEGQWSWKAEDFHGRNSIARCWGNLEPFLSRVSVWVSSWSIRIYTEYKCCSSYRAWERRWRAQRLGFWLPLPRALCLLIVCLSGWAKTYQQRVL